MVRKNAEIGFLTYDAIKSNEIIFINKTCAMKYSRMIGLLTVTTMIVFVTAGMFTPTGKFKNLKVLPQDISESTLDSFMNLYCKALKVNCDFCHTPAKDIFGLTPPNGDLVFSLDNPMKENAR